MKIPEGWPTGAMCVAFEKGSGIEVSMREFADGLRAALAATPTPPAQEAEPVGYISQYSLDSIAENPCGEDVTVWKQYDHVSPIAIYTRPQSDSLRKAAEEASIEIGKFLDGQECSLDIAHENLRKALEGKS